MFGIVSMMRITGVEISKNVQNKQQIKEFENTVNLIYTLCVMSEMMISTMFAIVSMMRITGVEISKQSKCAKQTANRKVLKHCKFYIHCVRHVGNDDLNYVWNS